MENQQHDMAKMFTNLMLYPRRQPLVKNPGDYDLEYQDVSIQTDDGVTLAAWLMKGSGDGVIIIGHPGTFTKYGWSLAAAGDNPGGYTRDVEFIPAAKHLVDAGYSVLMYDMRNHGESGATPNGGPHEPVNNYHDTLAVTKFAATHPQLAGKDIGLLSFCQSSFVSMVAMTQDPEALKEAGVKAFVAVQPIPIEIFYRRAGIPAPVVDTMKELYAEKGLSMDDQNPLHYAQNVFVPTLFVQAIMDSYASIDSCRDIYNAIPTEKEALWLTGDLHRFDTYNWFNDHPEKLLEWFGRYV